MLSIHKVLLLAAKSIMSAYELRRIVFACNLVLWMTVVDSRAFTESVRRRFNGRQPPGEWSRFTLAPRNLSSFSFFPAFLNGFLFRQRLKAFSETVDTMLRGHMGDTRAVDVSPSALVS